MPCRITDRTPKQDGFFMPAEFSPIRQVWMLWPERPDNWRDGAKPAQAAYARVAEAVARFADVTVGVSCAQYENCRAKLPPSVRVVEIASNDAWVRDCGPTFLKNAAGETRAADWEFNAWGGLYDGAYFPWDKDAAVARKICEIERVDSYRPRGFVLEGGSFHVDGEGTVLTTEMCLLSPGRNPHLDKAGIERMLCEYLGAEKVLWLKDGIDPTSDATKLDITENPKNLDIQEIAAEQLPRSLADVDLAVINGNYALQADLNAAEDSLITENPDYAKVYVNVVACRSGEENSDKIQALKKAMQSDDVKKYVDETYKGAVVTVF